MALQEFASLSKTGLRIILGLPAENSLIANNNVEYRVRLCCAKKFLSRFGYTSSAAASALGDAEFQSGLTAMQAFAGIPATGE